MDRVRPADLETPALRTVVRGYDKLQVQEMLLQARHEIASLIGELSSAREEIDRLRLQLQSSNSQENSIKETLIVAQRAAEDLRIQTHKEAAQMIADARHRADETLREYESKINGLRWDLERLRLERQKYIKEFCNLLENQLRTLAEDAAGHTEVRGEAAVRDSSRSAAS